MKTQDENWLGLALIVADFRSELLNICAEPEHPARELASAWLLLLSKLAEGDTATYAVMDVITRFYERRQADE